MNASIHTSGLPASLLFLCRSESAVRMDAKNLRGLGIRSLSYATGSDEALKLLERPGKDARVQTSQVDLVVCDEQMARHPASVFLYAMAGHPALRRVPVLVLASGSRSASLYRQAGLPVLERPYTGDQLRSALVQAFAQIRPLDRKTFETASENGLCLTARERAEKASVVKAPVTTGDLYREGMALLKKQEYAAAREYFLQVLARQEDHLEACLALARTYQAEQRREDVQCALVKAAAVCLRLNDHNRANHIASMLPVGMRNNIFAHEALIKMRQGEYRSAALSFLEAGRQRPDQPLHRLIARACLLTTRPEIYMSKICEALEGLGHKLTATALRRRLLEYPEFREASAGSRWLDRFPRLKEAVSVATCTASAWKEA